MPGHMEPVRLDGLFQALRMCLPLLYWRQGCRVPVVSVTLPLLSASTPMAASMPVTGTGMPAEAVGHV